MREFRLGDGLVIGLILLVGAILLIASFLPKEAGVLLSVESREGEVRYSLAVDREFDVVSNGHTLHIVIQEGKAWVASSDCPDKTCLHMGELARSGDAVICVPAEVVLRCIGEVSDDDIVAG